PQQIRRRAGAALTQLLANFSEVRPVVIVVDDLQWGDLDSADLLLELMQSQTPMAVLLILCFRREDPDANPGLKTIRQFMNASRDVEDIAIGNLTDAAAVPLVRQLLQETGQNGGLATAIAHEAAGNPLLIREFVEYVAASKLQFSGTVSFESALRARMERLSGAAKNLLIAIALA